MAAAAATHLGAAVLAHDWAMSGLRPYPELQGALENMDPPGHRQVGWSILQALARAQLRRGCSIVLDGVARAPEIAQCRSLAEEEAARFLLVLTKCEDATLHRSRVEARRRDIPNWYELEWDHVLRSREAWEPIDRVDLVVDADQPVRQNIARLERLLDSVGVSRCREEGPGGAR
jgi:predicted kinase